jgi:Calx-beta domain
MGFRPMIRRTVLLALLVAAATLVAVPAQACAADFPTVRLAGNSLVFNFTRAFYPVSESSSLAFDIEAAGGCGPDHDMSVHYATGGGSATPSADYQPVSGAPVFDNVQSEPVTKTFSVPINGTMEEEPVVESVELALSNPGNTTLASPSSAPILIIDDDGSSRVGLEGVPYSQIESFAGVQIPVFRAGNDSAPHQVGFSLTPGPGTPATPGVDVSPASGSVTIPGGQPWTMLNLTLQNDTLEEGPEEFTVTLSGPGVDSPSSMTFTIVDNEESVFPISRFHHPRHKWRYKKSDFRIREVHVFADDNLGKENVVAVDFALRRNLKNQECVWLTKSGWQKKDCQNREWLDTKYDATGELWWHRLKQLKSSVGTKIKNYTAFARAIDSGQNVEKDFNEKRNANTFEVKRSKRKR